MAMVCFHYLLALLRSGCLIKVFRGAKEKCALYCENDEVCAFITMIGVIEETGCEIHKLRT